MATPEISEDEREAPPPPPGPRLRRMKRKRSLPKADDDDNAEAGPSTTKGKGKEDLPSSPKRKRGVRTPSAAPTSPPKPLAAGRANRGLRRSGAILFGLPPSSQLTPREILRNECANAASRETPFTPRADEVIPRLFISDVYTATDDDFLRESRITHVVSVLHGRVLYEHETPYLKSLDRLVLTLEDTKEQASRAAFTSCLARTTAFINRAFSTNSRARVLVHCFAGISRSPSVVLAYLMSIRHMTLDHALETIRAQRPVVRPNPGFMEQLRYHEKNLKNKRCRSETPETELDSDVEVESVVLGSRGTFVSIPEASSPEVYVRSMSSWLAVST